jgi:hypothetical protein
LPRSDKTAVIAAVAIAVAALAAVAVLATFIQHARDAQPAPTAALACPPTGTVFTMSMPLAISAMPVFTNRVAVIGTDGQDCHINSAANGVYWLHAGIVNRYDQETVRAAAEKLWPLRVGNRARANFWHGREHRTLELEVASYDRFTARIGTYEAFRITETVAVDGRFLMQASRWWAPALRYTLSFRSDYDHIFYEIADTSSANDREARLRPAFAGGTTGAAVPR